MRFYDFMTLVWAVLLAVPTGVAIWALGGREPAAVPLGAIGVIGMAVAVVLWRMYKDPG